jgi:hypothetical protein
VPTLNDPNDPIALALAESDAATVVRMIRDDIILAAVTNPSTPRPERVAAMLARRSERAANLR